MLVNQLRKLRLSSTTQLSAMAQYVLPQMQVLAWQKATGEALSEVRQAVPTGNPRDPLIGFPVIFCVGETLSVLADPDSSIARRSSIAYCSYRF